jgi:hypothetical protein
MVGAAGYVGSAVAATTFAVRYGLWSTWRATMSGQVLFGLITTLAAILDLSLVLRWWWMPPNQVLMALYAGLFLMLFGGLAHLNVVLWRAQRRIHNGNGARDEEA